MVRRSLIHVLALQGPEAVRWKRIEAACCSLMKLVEA
jgi:hypothetical protein